MCNLASWIDTSFPVFGIRVSWEMPLFKAFMKAERVRDRVSNVAWSIRA